MIIIKSYAHKTQLVNILYVLRSQLVLRAFRGTRVNAQVRIKAEAFTFMKNYELL